MNICFGGMQKLSLLDFPGGKVCSILFTSGCNMRCPFCHNFELVQDKTISIDFDEVVEYLVKRKNMIDGITISGGEPTIYKDLPDFIKYIRNMTGLKIKLDTNGTNPSMIKKLIQEKSVDYIAMDVKNDFSNYSKITGIENFDVSDIKESIKIIEKDMNNYEFRTTIMKSYHDIQNIEKIVCYLDKNSDYYMQQYMESEYVPDKNIIGYTDDELKEMYKTISLNHPNAHLRGVK